MDGPHDLGGKDGFGAIDVEAPDFREDWERRQWALSKNVPLPGGTIDWWRHVRETSIPADYLTRPYLDSWLETDMTTLPGKYKVNILA